MKRPNEYVKPMQELQTIVMLTGVFEGLASMRIAQIKNQVQQIPRELIERCFEYVIG